jgi:hypothetical protein
MVSGYAPIDRTCWPATARGASTAVEVFTAGRKTVMFKSWSNSLIARGIRPNIGAVTLALLFGLYSMIYGVSLIVVGIEGRRTGKTLDSVLPHAA